MAARPDATTLDLTRRWDHDDLAARRRTPQPAPAETTQARLAPPWPGSDEPEVELPSWLVDAQPAPQPASPALPAPAWDVAPPPATTVPTVNGPFARPELATLGSRFGAWLLDGLLQLVTLGIGYLVWSVVAFTRGQTPAMSLVGIAVADHRSGRTVGFARMFFARGLLGGVVAVVTTILTAGLVLLLPLLRHDRRSIRDLVAGTIVVRPGARSVG